MLHPPRLFSSLCALLIAGVVDAHDLWLERDAIGYTLFQGHRHSAHEGDEVVPYAASFVRAALCVAPDGAITPLPIGDAYPARFPGDCLAVVVEASSGAWTTTAEGTRNEPPGHRPGVLRSWQAFESVKRLDGWSDALLAPFGDGLEIVPLHDPFALRRRDKLRLKVTLRGQPQPGVTVAYAGEARGVTGRDGTINLRIRDTGPQYITASMRETASAGGVAHWVHGAALQFDLQ